MAITYVGGATAVSTGNTDVSVSLAALAGGSDSSPTNGDLIIFAYNVADADNVDLDQVCNTAGFAEIADLFGNGTNDANLGVYWKIHDGDAAVVGEGSAGGTDTAIQGVAMVFRGVNVGTPFDVTSTTATGTTGGNPDPPSIDHNNPAGLWTVIVGANAHTANTNGTFTAPANYTTDFLTVGNQDTADGIIGMGYRTDPADPENPGAMTSSATATGWCACTIALRPAVPVSVTPGIATLTLTPFAATVTTTNNQVVTPGLATLTTTKFAPTVTVSDNTLVTPSIASLTLTLFVPTVTIGSPGITVTPGTAALTISTFASTVTASNHQTVIPGVASLTLSRLVPTVSVTNHQLVTPGIASLILTRFAPLVTSSNHQFVMPGTRTLTLTPFVPTVAVGVRVIPGTASLALSLAAPTITVTNHQTVTPGLALVSLTTFAPTVLTPRFVVPGTASLTITRFAPFVTTGLPLTTMVSVVLHLTPVVARDLSVTVGTSNTIQWFVLDELGVPILAEDGGFIVAEVQPYDPLEAPKGLVRVHLTPELQQTVEV